MVSHNNTFPNFTDQENDQYIKIMALYFYSSFDLTKIEINKNIIIKDKLIFKINEFNEKTKNEYMNKLFPLIIYINDNLNN